MQYFQQLHVLLLGLMSEICVIYEREHVFYLPIANNDIRSLLQSARGYFYSLPKSCVLQKLYNDAYGFLQLGFTNLLDQIE